MDNLELVSGQTTTGDEELIPGTGKVSSVGFGAELECEDVKHKVGTTILFTCIHSGDVKSASEKCWGHTTFQLRCFIVCALYGTLRLSAHWPMCYIEFTMLDDL
jgi:hypothetical protein